LPVGSLGFSRARFFFFFFRAAFLTIITVGWVMASVRANAKDDPAPTVSIAAAANLVYALDALDAAFVASTPGTKVTVATGASGNLVAQIRNGAPYDVFLSADLEFPRALVQAGHADPHSLQTFATGRLVLWTTSSSVAWREPPADASARDRRQFIATIVRDPSLRRLAIANVETAPYGSAAKQALENLGVWSEAQSKIVVGENITQTAQFVETGNAEAGFVALSLVLSPKLHTRGHWVEVPADLYAPLEQGVVLTQRGAANPAAASYLSFLRSEAARKILERFGYSVPH